MTATFAPTGFASNSKQSVPTRRAHVRGWISAAFEAAGLDLPTWSTTGRDLLAATSTRAANEIAASALARATAGEDVEEVARGYFAESAAAAVDQTALTNAVMIASLREASAFASEHSAELAPAWDAAVTKLAKAGAKLPIDNPLDRERCTTRASSDAWFIAAEALDQLSILCPVKLNTIEEKAAALFHADGDEAAEALADAVAAAEDQRRRAAQGDADAFAELVVKVSRGDLDGVSLTFPG